jgi:hypothetical protein
MSNLAFPEPDWASLSKQEATDLASDRLAEVAAQLKAAQKALRRDWPNLSPGERSAGSRVVKQLEAQQQALYDVLEMNRTES